MEDLHVRGISGVSVVHVGDSESKRRHQPGERQKPKEERKRAPDELAFLLRRSRVASASLVDTRVEFLNEGDELRVRIVDAATGETVGEMSGEELAQLAREAHVTTGVLREWRQ